MPAQPITGSPNLSVLDFTTYFNIPTGKLNVDLTGTVWTGSGQTLIVGYKTTIVSPSGQIVNAGSTNYLGTATSINNLPKIGGVTEWGLYQIRVVLKDANNNDFTLEKSFNLCAPNKANVSSETGVALFKLEANCENYQLKVFGGEGYSFMGKQATSWVKNITFFYPNSSGVADLKYITATPFIVDLYSGWNEVAGESVGLFDFDDRFKVYVKFSGSKEKYVFCNMPCHIFCAYKKMMDNFYSIDCHSKEYADAYQKLQEINLIMPFVQFGLRCGQDVDSYVEKLEELLDVKNCPCGSGSTQPAATTTTTTTVAP